jgi:hypothetical protein
MWPAEQRGVESADGGAESRAGRMLRVALPRLSSGVPGPCWATWLGNVTGQCDWAMWLGSVAGQRGLAVKWCYSFLMCHQMMCTP